MNAERIGSENDVNLWKHNGNRNGTRNVGRARGSRRRDTAEAAAADAAHAAEEADAVAVGAAPPRALGQEDP